MIKLWIMTNDYYQVIRHICYTCKDRAEAEEIAKYFIKALNIYISEN